nr:6-hydroxymethylpterin diphosphokinase MptE-like protein [Saccharibacillus sp. JS10]
MQELQKLREDFIDYRNLFESNRSTEKLFQKTWLTNSVNQLAEMIHSPSIFELAGSLKGSTAVIVASGPSLEQDIEWIKKFLPHALVISAGSSIQALVKYGIKPHISTVMDGGEINEDIFSMEGTLDSSLFYVSSAYPISKRKLDDSFYSIVQNDVISKYLLGNSNENFEILPTPTVTGTAIQVATLLGANKIILTGQDLSFQNDKFYTAGIEHAYGPHVDQIVQQSKHYVKNVFGEYNRTTNAFLMMKDSLESLISNIPSVNFINATRGGAEILGTSWKSAEEVYEEIKNQSIQENVIRELIQHRNQVNRSEKSKETLKVLEQKIEKVLSESLEVQGELRQLKRQIDKLPELSRNKVLKAWKSLEDIESAWAKVVAREWFNPIFETVLSDQLNNFDRELPKIIVETEIRKKATLVYEHLGNLVSGISAELPWVQQILQDGVVEVHRFNRKG